MYIFSFFSFSFEKHLLLTPTGKRTTTTTKRKNNNKIKWTTQTKYLSLQNDYDECVVKTDKHRLSDSDFQEKRISNVYNAFHCTTYSLCKSKSLYHTINIYIQFPLLLLFFSLLSYMLMLYSHILPMCVSSSFFSICQHVNDRIK